MYVLINGTSLDPIIEPEEGYSMHIIYIFIFMNMPLYRVFRKHVQKLFRDSTLAI